MTSLFNSISRFLFVLLLDAIILCMAHEYSLEIFLLSIVASISSTNIYMTVKQQCRINNIQKCRCFLTKIQVHDKQSSTFTYRIC